jgi:hypothetical protein
MVDKFPQAELLVRLLAHANRFKKIDIILALQQPQTVKQLHSFLGVVA